MGNVASRMEPTVKQTHSRILREQLARIYRMSPPKLQLEITGTLATFAVMIKQYCTCPEKALTSDGQIRCLDCLTIHQAIKDGSNGKAKPGKK